MNNFIKKMSHYHSHHTKISTKLTHALGVPAIVISLQILICWWSTPLAWLAVTCFTIYFFFQDQTLALITGFFLVISLYFSQHLVATSTNMQVIYQFSIFFIAGWVMQLIGHYFEGKKPSLTEDLSQVIIAPIFLAAELLFAFGIKKDLQRKILEAPHQ